MKELHLTEGRNTGFGKILRALEENGSPKPEFETDDDHSYFISRLFVHEAFLREEKKEREQKGAEKKWDILQRMKEESTITQVKLMEEFNLTRKQVQKIIKDLREDGLVERQGVTDLMRCHRLAHMTCHQIDELSVIRLCRAAA